MICPREWLVCFYDPVKGRRRWWYRFAKPGFRHCNAIAYLAELDRWLVADWGYQGHAIYLLSAEEIRPVFTALMVQGKVLRYRTAAFDNRRDLRVLTEWPLHCVAMVRNLLGIRRWCLTPWQLFCALRAASASPMFEPEPRRSGGAHGDPI